MQKANGLDEFYSHMKRGGSIELFLDRSGNPTLSYPHVHVVHLSNGKVDIVASRAQGDHRWRTTLSNPSGNDVNSAVRTAQGYL